MKLICELNEEVETISEGAGDAKKLYIKGVFLQAGIKNRNGRVYSPDIMENAVNSYIDRSVKQRCAYGELNHPDSPALNLERASHRIVSLVREGNNWIGKAVVLNTPMGNIARGLIEDDCKLGVSSRGVGSIVRKDGAAHVCEDFRIATAADIVSDPSAPDAFVNGIMENVEWVWNDQNGYEALAAADKIKNALDRDAHALNESQRLQAFHLFLEKVKYADFDR